MFSDYFSNLQKCSLGKKNVDYFGKKKLKSESVAGTFFHDKMFPDLSKTLHTLSLGEKNVDYFGKKKSEKIINGKKSNFKFQNRGDFGKKIKNPYG